MSPLGRAQYLEIATFLEGYLLHAQGDRMLMGNSVEGRFPYLDHRVAELAARLPDRLRLRGLQEKYALRAATSRYLPPEIRERPQTAIPRADRRDAGRDGCTRLRSRAARARADRRCRPARPAAVARLVRKFETGEGRQRDR